MTSQPSIQVLLGDASKARRELGWVPRVTFDALVTMMVDADLVLAKRDLASTGEHFST